MILVVVQADSVSMSCQKITSLYRSCSYQHESRVAVLHEQLK